MPRAVLREIAEVTQRVVKGTYRLARHLRRPLGPLFHWNYVGSVAFAVLLAGVVTLMTTQAFSFARWSITIGGFWIILWWLSSDHVLRERPSDSCSDRSLWNAYRLKEWVPALLGLCMLLYLVKFTNNSEREYQRSNVSSHLLMSYSAPDEYGDNPLKSIITVQNNSDYDISPRHRLVCENNLSVGNDGTSATHDLALAKMNSGWMIISGGELPPLADSSKEPPLLKGGDGQSDSCMAAFGFTNDVMCLDFTVVFQYQLSLQPEFEQRKYLRIVSYKTDAGKYVWHQQPIDQRVSYCASFLKPLYH